MIDGVLSTIRNLEGSDDGISSTEMKYLETTLEKIRSHNEELRKWGNEQYERAEELEKDLNDKQRTVDGLEDDVSELKKEVRNLENEIESLSLSQNES